MTVIEVKEVCSYNLALNIMLIHTFLHRTLKNLLVIGDENFDAFLRMANLRTKAKADEDFWSRLKKRIA